MTARKFTGEEAATAGVKGGKAAHEQGAAHEFTAEEAREAGRKGGRANVGDRPARVAEEARRQADAAARGRGRGGSRRRRWPDGRRWPSCGLRG